VAVRRGRARHDAARDTHWNGLYDDVADEAWNLELTKLPLRRIA
jgi:hypothetical protein